MAKLRLWTFISLMMGVMSQCAEPNCLVCTEDSPGSGNYICAQYGISCSDGCGNCDLSTGDCTSCNHGYYIDQSGDCQLCPGTCDGCSGATTCDACVEGYYLDTAQSVCIQCPIEGCTCSFPYVSTCINCLDGYYLDGPICTKCDSGPGCTCADSSPVCTDCIDGYLDSGVAPATCNPCDTEGCTCGSSLGDCDSCLPGYYSDNSSCAECSEGCSICVGPNQDECFGCKRGFYLDGNTCSECNQPGCSACSDSLTCNACEAGYYLYDGECLECTGGPCTQCNTLETACTDCGAGYYLMDGVCLACQGGPCGQCDVSETVCTACYDDTSYLNNEVCSLKTGGNCATYDNANGLCGTCQSGYYNKDGNCLSCSGGPCTECDDGITMCTNCLYGYYLDSGMCKVCDSSCKTCSGSATTCTSCDDGEYLGDSNSDGIDECLACSSSCKTCSGSATTCTSCADGEYLGDSNSDGIEECLACSSSCKTCSGSATTCTSCADGEYLGDSNSDGIDECLACDSSCKTCSGSATTCTSCDDGYYLKNGSCVQCVGGCSDCTDTNQDTCTECLPGAGNDESNCDCTFGYYELLTGSFRTCPKCTLALCADCSDSSTCSVCVDNATLATEGADAGTCSCNEGYVGNTSSNPKYCVKCPYLCETCDANGICSKCFDDAGDDPTECDCVKGFYYKNGRCEPCHELCSECGPLGCTTPKSDATCDDEDGTCECDAGYYQTGSGSSAACSKCDDLCANCDSSSTCTDGNCVSNATFDDDDDVCVCDENYFKDGSTTCTACKELCKVCSGTSDCAECVENAAFKSTNSGECGCTLGYYYNSESNECIQCPDLCEECTATKCTRCKVNSKLDDNDSCECIDGYRSNGRICERCTANFCKSCPADKNTCTECVEYTTGSPGSCTCASGFYPYENNLRCAECPPLATSCDPLALSPTISCKTNAVASADNLSCECASGYYFFDDNCIACEDPLATSCPLGISTACIADATLNASDKTCYCNANLKYYGGSCIACEGACDTCTHGGCTACKDTNISSLSGGVCTCNAGYYDNGSGCVACRPLCTACTSATSCTTCKSNAGDSAANACGCTDSTTCTCAANYSYNSVTKSCDASCGSNCTTCNTDGPGCSVCNSGYYVGSDSFCAACISNCNTCTGILVGECTMCADNYYYVSSSNICDSVPSGCIRKTGDHTKIEPADATTYIKVDNGTTTCPALAPTNCNRDSNDYSLVAPAGTYLNNFVCTACNPACATCSYCSDGDCINSNRCDSGYGTCITNAEVSSKNCVCSKSYTISNSAPYSCNYNIPTGCGSANESDHTCLTCSINYEFWTDVNGCYADCPTTYTTTNNNGRNECAAPADATIFEALLNEDKELVKTDNSFTLTGTGVVPAYQRGWYFKASSASNQYYAELSPAIVYGVNFSIQFWVYFESVSDSTILSKSDGTNTLKVYIESGSLKMQSKMESYDKHFEKSDESSVLASSVAISTWYKVTITVSFSSSTTTVNGTLDDTPSTAVTFSSKLVYDTSSSLILGWKDASANAFNGFIAYFITANSVSFTSALEVPTSFPGCAFSTVPKYDASDNLSCENCPTVTGGCTLGCANKETCSTTSIDKVCSDLLCDTCATLFEICDTCKNLASKNTSTGQCSCVTNATFDVTSKTCKCNFGFVASDANDRCIIARDYLQQGDISAVAYSSSSYQTITISLGRPILKNQFSTCQSLFTANSYSQIGSDAVCSLSSTNNLITVTLNENATFTSGDLYLNTLVLIGTTINTRTEVTPLKATVSLLATKPALTAVITAPTIFSLSCNNNSLLLKSDSSTFLKRFGITYAWTVSGTGRVDTSADITGTASSLVITADKLIAGSLTVSLTIKNTNDVSTPSTATATVTVVGSNKLEVAVPSSFSTSQKRNVQIAIPLNIGNRCSTNPSNLSYEWSYDTSTNTGFNAATALGAIATNLATYTTPANTFVGPYTYTFKVTVKETVSGNVFSGDTSVTLDITNEALEGAFSFTNQEENGIFSTLSDLEITFGVTNLHSTTATYAWTCQREDVPGFPAACSQTTSANTLTILMADLVAYKNYTITATATTSDSRSLNKSLNIIGLPVVLPMEFLDAPIKPSSTQELVFFPAITDSGASNYNWDSLNPVVFITEFSYAPLLVISSGTLSSSTPYHLQLSYSSDAGQKSKQVLFITNSPPKCSSVSITPDDGAALSTIFTLSAVGCTDDEDLELSYTFSITYRSGTTNYIVRIRSKSSTYQSKFPTQAISWKVEVCDLKLDCYVSGNLNFPWVNPDSRRMLNSEILDDFNTMVQDHNSIPAATIMALISDTLDRETYNTIKATFDNYINSVNSTDYTRDLVVSIYRAIIEYQSQILENSEILDMIQTCYDMVLHDDTVKQSDAREILESFYKVIESRSYDQEFVAESLELLNKVFMESLDNSPPRSISDGRISDDFYYARLFGNSLKGLSVPLNSMNVTLPDSFADYGDYKMYDLFIKAFKTEGLPIFLTYLAEVGYYERPNIVYYDSSSLFNETDDFIFQFEVPYNSTDSGLAVKCQIYSEEAGLWQNVGCTGKISDSKVKVSTSSLGTMRLITVEEDLLDTSDEECEMNPAAFSIVCFWLSLMTVLTIINYLTSRKQPELYNVVGAGVMTGSKHVNNFEKPGFSPRSQIEDVDVPRSNFLNQYILLNIFRNSSRWEKVYSMLSLVTASLTGFAILGGLLYHYGDVDDNSDASFNDISENYYPEDLKMVFIALALVIPIVLPIRLISKLTGVLRPLFVAFTVLTLIGSIVGVLTMGAIYCQGAVMRWTLSYLIFIPLELAISELILAAVVHFAGTN